MSKAMLRHVAARFDLAAGFERARRTWLLPLAVALVATVPSFVKPLTIDDAAYVQYARQIAQHPTRPYDFMAFWGASPKPANEVLAPPLALYWWAAGMRVVGDSETLWHAWFLPFPLVAAWALFRLSVRFDAPPVLTAIVFFWSPLFMPQVNFMLDVPALALGLAALAFFCDNAPRRRWRSVLAGVLLGGSLLAKYSALGVLAGAACYAVVHRRRDFAWCLLAAAATVVGCEGWLYVNTGESHWCWHWLHAARDLGFLSAKTWQHARDWLVFMGGGLPLAGLVGLALVPRLRPACARLACAVAVLLMLVRLLRPETPLAESLFAAAGCLALGVACAAAFARGTALAADDVFLLAWLAVESVNAVLPVPFMAMRRCLAPAVPLVLLLLRHAGPLVERMRRVERRRLAGVVAAGCALGVVVGLADSRFAIAQRDTIRAIERDFSGRSARVWFSGHWGWQHYAGAAGMLPLDAATGEFAPGDFVVEVTNVDSQELPDSLRRRSELWCAYAATDTLPIRVQNRLAAASYHGAPGLPYSVSSAPHLTASVWRVRGTQ